MITDAQIDAAIRAAARDLSEHDQDTLMVIMAQAAACHLSERESAESIARVRARLMREFGVT